MSAPVASANDEDFLYARYDILWRKGNGSIGPNEGCRGERITIQCHDPDPPPENDERVASVGENASDGMIDVAYKYRALFLYGEFRATYSELCYSIVTVQLSCCQSAN